MTWHRVILLPSSLQPSADEVDTICAELIAAGACGTAVESAPQLSCFIDSADPERLAKVLRAAELLGCRIVSREEIPERNWAASCPELWKPIRAGRFEIIPVESGAQGRDTSDSSLVIIPGLGFGTGHHPTTNMILSVLGELELPGPIDRVYDLGTGSGILAIAAAKLLKAPVVAIDIDPLAIENAAENVALNNVAALVSPSTTPAAEVQGPFPLIIANLYGEALVSLSGEVTRVAASRCTAILSGIMELVSGQVTAAFCGEHGWRVVDERSEDGWICLVLQRP